MLRKSIASTLILALLGGCASSTKDLAPSYISPLQYQSYSCRQIEDEMQSVSAHVSEVGGVVDNNASGDAMKMGVGLVLFWPTLFFLDGDGQQAAEYSRLKGEFDALEKASIKKDCDIDVEDIRPKETPKPHKDEAEFPKGKDDDL
jgi:hypothetical protein